MIVVIRRTERPEGERMPGPRGRTVAVAALVALIVTAAALFWTTRQSPQEIGLGLPSGLVLLGCASAIAMTVKVRTITAFDIFDAACTLVAGFFALIGAILKGIWKGFLSLIGLD